ncbi:MAG: hydroxymethylbilane synthase [Mariprofundaceae bacterium]|nr:hydroxymethylbilane synthase [Mariprofundaceae bacterium]
MHIRIATRRSPLALWQAEFVSDELKKLQANISTELVKIITKGDKILDVPLAKVGGKGLFTKEIDRALADGRADVAVHSMKDVPTKLPQGMSICAIPEREDARDMVATVGGIGLKNLPVGAKVGSSSLRRICQLKRHYPHLECVSIRGSVQTRLDKLGQEVDAVILAAAGVKRLGLYERMDNPIDPEIMLPAVGQGTLAIQTCDDATKINALVSCLNHADTVIRSKAERAFLATLEGGCQVPIAGYATLDGDTLTVRGRVGDVEGKELLDQSIVGPSHDAQALGVQLAEQLLDAGAREILQEVYRNHTSS